MEEAHPEAAAILRDAGWKPHDAWNVYTRDTLVMGFQPDGLGFHVKNWAKVQPGDRSYSDDTPDTPEEAAAWLVQRFKEPEPETNPLSLDTLEFRIEDEVAGLLKTHLASEPEQVETPHHESDSETGETPDGGEQLPGAEAPEGPDVDDGAGHGVSGENTEVLGSVALADVVEPLDADFTIEDLGGPDETLELPAPEPEDFAPDEFEPEPEAPQDRFIGLDDLDRVRSLRIGDVATEALRLTTMIEQAVSEQEGEFSTIQAYVVSNLDKHTGAFTPQDDASRKTYGRFLELSSARSKIALIDARRKDATAFLIAAGRDEVVGFDVQAAFA